MYGVKEIFYTLQGEGRNAGRAAVFCRFAGCNLWSGREADRQSAVCRFCDTDFLGTDGTDGGKFAAADTLADRIVALWPRGNSAPPFAVLTGGEPALQVDAGLVAALHERNVEVAIETNGTIPLPEGIDWVCVSPKQATQLLVLSGDELKLVFPQPGLMPEDLPQTRFDHYLLQPMDGPERTRNTELAAAYCQERPHWKLSLQTHKLVGLR